MNMIKQGILMAVAAFTYLLLFSYFIDRKINWILSFEISSGVLLGILLMYLWKNKAGKKKESGD